jgi:hypothetical protein
MTDQNQGKNSARRRLLKSVVAGSGVFAVGRTLPESWLEPVVKSVALPAHAQTSPFAGPTGNFGAAVSSIGANERDGSILDMFVEPARALVPFDAVVGNVQFTAYYTVRENDALICGRAMWAGNVMATLSDTVGRTGDSLDDFSQSVGPVSLMFTNQQVSGGGVSLTASTDEAGNPSDSFIAPPGGPGCLNVTVINNSSSPYPDDEIV